MATRFYLEATGAAPLPDSWSAGWNKTTGANDPRPATTTKRTTSNGNTTGVASSGTSGHFTAGARFVSDPLDVDQTIDGTLKGQVRCAEAVATDNFTLAIAVKVIQPSGADRGVLLAVSASDDTAATPPEMSVSGTFTNRRFRDSAESASLTLSSLACTAGDRVVIEVGWRQASTSVNAGQLIHGTVAGQTDLPENDTQTTVGTAWVEFSATITTTSPAIFHVTSASTPTDDAAATGTADPTAISSDLSLVQTGDLVCMIGQQRATGAALAISDTGGQSWTSETAIGITNQTDRLFWCVFDGTWDANPSVDFSATTCNSVQMHVFRAPAGYTWNVNQALAETEDATSPYGNPGQTTTGSSPTLTLVGWFTADDNSWDAPSGTGWLQTGTAQYRNTSGSDQSASYAHYIQATGGATGAVSKTQNTVTGDACTTFAISWEASTPSTSFLYDSFAAMRPMLVRRVRELFSVLIPPKPAHALRFIASALRAANDALFRKAA